MCKQRHAVFPTVSELKLKSYPFWTVDRFLSNELSAVFEHSDLIVHHNKSIFAQLGSAEEVHSMWALVNYSFVKGHSFYFSEIHLCLGEFKQ